MSPGPFFNAPDSARISINRQNARPYLVSRLSMSIFITFDYSSACLALDPLAAMALNSCRGVQKNAAKVKRSEWEDQEASHLFLCN